MIEPNAELAYRVLDHIDAHPEQWNQDLYIGKADCGTVACFAGWTVLLSGAEPVAANENGATDRVIVGGRSKSVGQLAQELLSASRWVREGHDDEEDLFAGCNTRSDLGRLVEEIFGPRPAVTE